MPVNTAPVQGQALNYQAILKFAQKKSDGFILFLTLIGVGVGVFFLFEGTPLEISITVFLVVLISLVYVRLVQIRFLGNALRVQNGRHAYLLNIVQQISTNLQMPQVNVFITQDPYLNAFAIGYARPYTIVLHSATVEELSPEELQAILIHEMGHIKYRHTVILAYVQPIISLVPLVGFIVGWIFGFWSRRAELACDRLALAYTGNPHTVIMALIKIHVGSKFAEYLNEEGVLHQEQISSKFTKLVSQSLGSHPFLVTRVHALLDFGQKLGLGTPTTVPLPQAVYQQIAQPPAPPGL